jgi:selenocysteine lyase/cysteine desulfurase
MKVTRRDFMGTAAAAAAAGSSAAASAAASAACSSLPYSDPLNVRKDFPVTKEGVYLDSAYITPSPRQVTGEAQQFIAAKGRLPIQLGEMLQTTNQARRKFASLIGAEEHEVGMLYATSEGENIVARALRLRSGDNVVIDDLHYETTYNLYRHLAADNGVELRIVRNTEGVAPASAFAELIDDRTRLVSVSWVSHQNGYRHDLEALAEIAHAHGAYLYSDAIQGIGMLDLDVHDVGIDFLTTGTYKWLLGGYGVAPFYVRKDLLEVVEIDRWGSLHIARELEDFRYELHTDARKYGYATLAFGAVVELSTALDYLAQVGIANIEGHSVGLAMEINSGLRQQGFRVLTPEDNHSAIVTFEHGVELSTVRSDLQAANIKVSLKAGGSQIRVGAALFNNREEVRRFLDLTGSWV